jgi:hypothetical protein
MVVNKSRVISRARFDKVVKLSWGYHPRGRRRFKMQYYQPIPSLAWCWSNCALLITFLANIRTYLPLLRMA